MRVLCYKRLHAMSGAKAKLSLFIDGEVDLSLDGTLGASK